MEMDSHSLRLNIFIVLCCFFQGTTMSLFLSGDRSNGTTASLETTLNYTEVYYFNYSEGVPEKTEEVTVPVVTKETTLTPVTVPVETTETTLTPGTPTLPPSECLRRPSDDPSIKWFSYNGSCYSANTKDHLSYHAGSRFCKRHGAYLASVHSDFEMDFIYGLVRTNSGRFWIGLRRDHSSFTTKWEDGSLTDYFKWSHDDIFGYGDSCATFRTPTGLWDEHPCDNRYYVICKYQPNATIDTTPPPPTLPGNCPNGWYKFEDKCYKILGISRSERKYWDDAKQDCEGIYSTLVSIHSAEEQNFLTQNIVNLRTRIWIGLRRTSTRAPFRWEDNTPLDFSNWDEGEPNDHLLGDENCVQLLERYNALGKWNDAPCNLKFPYICQMSINPMVTKSGIDPSHCTEPEGWLKVKNSCFKVFHEIESPIPWVDAQSLCEEHNGTLATVKNSDVTENLRANMEDLDGYFWIGMNSTTMQRFTWIGGDPLIYSNWETDQPKEVSKEHNCVAVDAEGEWIVRDCNESLPFICEVKEEGPQAPTLPPHHPNMTCPSSSSTWHDFGGKYCYLIEIKERLKWYEALCHCKKAGGSLASFHSIDEVNVMVHYLSDFDLPLHIGFQRDMRGSFVWSDKSPIDFSYWDKSQPSSTREQCSSMYTKTGKWSDIQCAERHGYICSVEKVSEGTAQLPTTTNAPQGLVLSAGAIASISIICVLAVLAIAGVVLYYTYPPMKAHLSDKIPFVNVDQ